jgi:hypothetical protein
VAIYDAIYTAGMTFPFPRRDVHLVHDSESDSTDDDVKTDDKGCAQEIHNPAE